MPQYLGDKHIFTSRSNKPYTEIASGATEDLFIESLMTEDIHYSEVPIAGQFSNFGTIQTFSHSDTTTLRNQGTSVNVSEVGFPQIAFGCPFSPLQGGVGVFNTTNIGAPFIESAILATVGFTTSALYGTYSSMNENGDLIVFSDYANNSSSLHTYRYDGISWTASDILTGKGVSCKLYGDYIITGDYLQEVSIHFYSGGAWALQQTLNVAGGPNVVFDQLVMDGITSGYADATNLYLYTRSGTVWTLLQTIAIASIIGVSLVDDILSISTATDLYIYQRTTGAFSLISTFAVSNITDCATNGLNVFLSTTTDIKSYSLRNGAWFKTLTDTTLTGITRLASSTNLLVAGRPTSGTFGEVSVYQIIQRTGSYALMNSIIMNEDSIVLQSVNGGVIINNDLTVTGTINLSGASTILSVADGTVSLPSYTFTSDTDTGLYRPSANVIGLTTGGAQRLSVSDTSITSTVPIVNSAGTALLPSYTFTGDLNTGLYSTGADTVGLSVGGVEKLTLNTDFLTAVGGVSSANGFNRQQAGGAQSLANNTYTKLDSNFFTGTLTQTGDSVATLPTYSNGRFTINKAGVYFITCGITFPGFATRRDVNISVVINGTLFKNDVSSVLGDAGWDARESCVYVDSLAVNDFVEIFAKQDTGGVLSTTASITNFFILHRLC